MKQLIAVMMTFGVITSAWAGLIIDQTGKVTFGKVSEVGDTIVVEVKLGTTIAKKRADKETLKWWTPEEGVTNYLSGARQALADKKLDIARTLVNQSMKKEPLTKDEAKLVLTQINEAPTGGSTGDVAKSDDKKTGDDKKEEGIKVGGGKLYDLLKDHLLDPGTGKKFDGKTWGKADYYLLCFVSLGYPENRDVLRKIIGRYDSIKSDFNGKVECLFYPIDADPKVLAAQIPKMKIPFPILKSAIAKKTSLIKHKTSSASFAVVDSSGNLVFKGDNGLRLLIDLEDKMDQ